MPYFAIELGIVLAALDQAIKFYIMNNVPEYQVISAIPNVLNITHIHNYGVAFGMFYGFRWAFVVLTIFMMLAIVIYMFKKRPNNKLLYVSVALIVGGGIGNLIDRISLGYVVDYLSLSFFSPVCNFADYCITGGTIILVIYLLFFSDYFEKGKTVR